MFEDTSGQKPKSHSTIRKIIRRFYYLIYVVRFFKNPNKSKLYSGNNEEQIEFREYLLSFGAEYFVFQFAIQKYKVKDIQNHNVYLLFCMCVELGRSHSGRNVGC
jgi:hypothetical protein